MIYSADADGGGSGGGLWKAIRLWDEFKKGGLRDQRKAAIERQKVIDKRQDEEYGRHVEDAEYKKGRRPVEETEQSLRQDTLRKNSTIQDLNISEAQKKAARGKAAAAVGTGFSALGLPQVEVPLQPQPPSEPPTEDASVGNVPLVQLQSIEPELQTAPVNPRAMLDPRRKMDTGSKQIVEEHTRGKAWHQLSPAFREAEFANAAAIDPTITRADVAEQWNNNAVKQAGALPLVDLPVIGGEPLKPISASGKPGEIATASYGTDDRNLASKKFDIEQKEKEQAKAVEVADLESTLKDIAMAEKLVASGAGGPVAGSWLGRTATQYLGSTEAYESQRQLEQFINQQVMALVPKLKGPLSEKELAFLMRSAPTLQDTPGVWSQYLTKLKDAVNKNLAMKLPYAQQSGDGSSQQSPIRVNSPEEAQKHKGKWVTNGTQTGFVK
jgi:hypothetical protein